MSTDTSSSSAGPQSISGTSPDHLDLELKDLSAQASSIGGSEIPTATVSPQHSTKTAKSALLFSFIFLFIPSLIIGLCFGVGLGPEWKRIVIYMYIYRAIGIFEHLNII